MYHVFGHYKVTINKIKKLPMQSYRSRREKNNLYRAKSQYFTKVIKIDTSAIIVIVKYEVVASSTKNGWVVVSFVGQLVIVFYKHNVNAHNHDCWSCFAGCDRRRENVFCVGP